jgi:conjugal transfer pilin signal peptidase TrbI
MRMRARILLMAAATFAFVGARNLADVAGRFRFGINETTSLPNWAFIVDRANRQPRRGQLVQFIAPDNPYYPQGSPFVKHVWGLPGDRVERRGREYYIAGRDLGFAKPFSQTGRATRLGPVGVIPAGRYYVGTASQDSLDSRYGEIGWIAADRIVGVAEPVL